MSATTFARAAAGRQINLARYRDLSLIPVLLLLLIVGRFADDAFFTSKNLLNVTLAQTELGLIVLAESLVLIVGKFDLSLESTIGFAPAVGIVLVVPEAAGGLGTEWPHALAVPICLGVGALVGAFNGLLILRFKLSAFIVTLGMLIMLRGLMTGVTEGKSLFELPNGFSYLGNTKWLGVRAAIWLVGLLYALGICLLTWFRHGRALYAIGGNEDAARAAGIRTTRITWIVFILAGVLAAFAGVLMTGRLGSVGAAQGDGMIFLVFAAAVIGGISLDGGKGTLFGALCGVWMLGLITNILTFAGVDARWLKAIYGAIILVALVITRITSGKAQD